MSKKMITSPKLGVLLLVSFSFLLLAFQRVDDHSLPPGRDHQAPAGSLQPIPDTYTSRIYQTQREIPQFNIFLPVSLSTEVDVAAGALKSSTYSSRGEVKMVSEADELRMISGSAFDQFVQEVLTGDGEMITGVYVEGVLALRVVQQPYQNMAFVSNEEGTATQFQSATRFGVIGLLAHNYLSGRYFLNLSPGHEILLVFGDGQYRRYRVSGITDFERLTFNDVNSNFRDLSTQSVISSVELFNRFYRGDNTLTLQTCLEGDGYTSWGVRMVSAEPVESGD
jgi:hypothetical protein